MDFFKLIRTVTAAYLEVRELPPLPAEPERDYEEHELRRHGRAPLDEHVAADNRERFAEFNHK